MLKSLAVVALAVGCAFAQQKTQPGTHRSFDTVASSPEPDVYVPLTQRDRLNHYARTTFGPATLLAQPIQAAFTMATDVVPEWGKSGTGYGKQLGLTVLNLVASNTIEYGAAAALGEDNTYYRCKCSGFFPRTGHALFSPLTARNNQGHKRFSLSRVLGAYGGGMLNVPVMPARYNYKGDGLRQGNWNYGLNFPIAIFREFWPELTGKFHR
ncbi:MAG: hypothetical protein M3O35_22450 [Acidobacteriota bacterium]|nr:hypothetical protein [Acidobacteriota bacterium]